MTVREYAITRKIFVIVNNKTLKPKRIYYTLAKIVGIQDLMQKTTKMLLNYRRLETGFTFIMI